MGPCLPHSTCEVQTLKHACRRAGIGRWPHRFLASEKHRQLVDAASKDGTLLQLVPGAPRNPKPLNP